MNKQDKRSDQTSNITSKVVFVFGVLFIGFIVSAILILNFGDFLSRKKTITSFNRAEYYSYKENLKKMEELDAYWEIPEIYTIKNAKLKESVKYGKDLIMHTSRYLGPNGSVEKLSNGMNCQNCHLDAGTKIWGNNYAAVASTYPKIRARSGKMENIEKRVNDCFERSLNGRPLKNDSKEMIAIVNYMKFLGTNVKKDSIPQGTGIFALPFLNRPSDSQKGSVIYSNKCASCHGINGEGMLAQNNLEYTYPPLWGSHSYNTGAGLFRMSRLAGYIKYNMPLGATFLSPQLNDEDSWDLAAFINSQARPSMDISKDWPDITKKPIDHPFGPYSDQFSEVQHKYGPFKIIEDQKKKK